MTHAIIFLGCGTVGHWTGLRFKADGLLRRADRIALVDHAKVRATNVITMQTSSSAAAIPPLLIILFSFHLMTPHHVKRRLPARGFAVLKEGHRREWGATGV